MKLEDMTLDELKQLRKDVVKAIDTFEARQMAEARAKLEEYAKEMGVKLEDVMGAGKGKGKPKGPPKYCHPNDPSLTWTGKGRKPDWLKRELDAGMSLERFKI
jgi:DNA-binding protein H-NS